MNNKDIVFVLQFMSKVYHESITELSISLKNQEECYEYKLAEKDKIIEGFKEDINNLNELIEAYKDKYVLQEQTICGYEKDIQELRERYNEQESTIQENTDRLS